MRRAIRICGAKSQYLSFMKSKWGFTPLSLPTSMSWKIQTASRARVKRRHAQSYFICKFDIIFFLSFLPYSICRFHIDNSSFGDFRACSPRRHYPPISHLYSTQHIQISQSALYHIQSPMPWRWGGPRTRAAAGPEPTTLYRAVGASAPNHSATRAPLFT